MISHKSRASILRYHNLYDRLYDLKGNRKILANVDFGVKFVAEREKCIHDHGLERSPDVVAITTNCEQMMLVDVEKIKTRLPSHKTCLKI